jgi:hydrogenase maturation protein HypF
MASACSVKVRGVVQGVGFRPFVFRLAQENTLAGWVLNGEEGVEIFLEGAQAGVDAFLQELRNDPPPAAKIAGIEIQASHPVGLRDFRIRESRRQEPPTTGISPDLPVCDDCLSELFNASDRRYRYPYINCTNCGPRYTVAVRLPYDRENTTMREWKLDDFCTAQYRDPRNRRFHAQPVACGSCGPGYYLQYEDNVLTGNQDSIRRAAQLLAAGKIVAVKGLGGYHLACDARNPEAVRALRERKYRKEKPFALMARTLEVARQIIEWSPDVEKMLTSLARPIVIARAKVELTGVAPESSELGLMLPYTPLHHLLFDAGAPNLLVMTSANRSSEPIAYEDSDALRRLASIADAFLVGERPIARRVDDSVARVGTFGPMILRRSRGYAPGAVTRIPTERPILALGADLKNTVTLVVSGQAFVSQHIGDLSDYQSLRSFQETIHDLTSMYDVDCNDLLVAHDVHPQYASTVCARSMDVAKCVSVQHHRAHIASVLAERREWEKRVVGVSFDGTGYGDDGTIWGGEIFVGSVAEGFGRIAHLRRAVLPGGDAAAQNPPQAAAGFLAQIPDLPDLSRTPFSFPERYEDSRALLQKGVRTFTTTSVGRLFDAVAALLGFTRTVTFEGQAAMWLEQLARESKVGAAYPFPFQANDLDFRPLLYGVVTDRAQGRAPSEIARSFQLAIAQGLYGAIEELCEAHKIDTAVLSGGVFQNELLLEDLCGLAKDGHLALWTNHEVPPNDGGISLGQAALAAFGQVAHENVNSAYA